MSDEQVKPVSGTREWASHSANAVWGCAHRCTYCYARSMANRFGRISEKGWGDEIAGGNELGRRPRRVDGTVMFPTTHDITPTNLDLTLPALRGLLEVGNQVLVVSKPHLEVIQRICGEHAARKSQILFRFSIGTERAKTLAFFEPGAPEFGERLASLQYAHAADFATSVSMEPLLEPDEDHVVALVEKLAPFVTESIWIGKLNRAKAVMTNNGTWNDSAARAVAIIEASQTDERCRSLVARLSGHPLVRWKESIKKAAGFTLATTADEGWAGSDG